MATNYKHIKADNIRRFGEDISLLGDLLLAGLYGERTHFILEILQNAEDALKKRGKWKGPRAVKFHLSAASLAISHFGKPFDEADVRGICGIGESKKELTDIGSFGIGFKSVFAFTDQPEIHSGEEHFAIDSYVWPTASKETSLQPEETIIYLPLKAGERMAHEDIVKGLRRLNLRTLLFLRDIEEISWSVENGPSGVYLRDKPENMGNGARRVLVIGEDAEEGSVEEEWIVFSREVFTKGESAGHVEIAFALSRGSEDNESLSVQPVSDSRLVVFFPTVLSTNLGFVMQGPYRTTPSRDSVPQDDPWNRHLVEETAVLLGDALKQLRDIGLLNVSAIECLPLDAHRFPDRNQFSPLYRSVKESLLTESLLPAYGGGHVSAKNAKLGTRDLRDLINEQRLADLFPCNDNPNWLSDEITAGRTHSLRNYLTRELDVDEVTLGSLIPKLTKQFLEGQPDEWIERLYVFLGGQRALLSRLRSIPLVRLEDGEHTVASIGGKPQVYLPGPLPTRFPIVKRGVCQSKEARDFLESLGLRVPDTVDEVLSEVLPKYAGDLVNVADNEYEYDIKQMLIAFETDSSKQRNDLVNALKQVKFIAAVDVVSGISQFVRPCEAYWPTGRLKSLFEDVPGALFVDCSKPYLRSKDARDFLCAVGTPEHLLPIPVEPSLTWEEKRELRCKTQGHLPDPAGCSIETEVKDFTLLALDSLIGVLRTMPVDRAESRAELLWDSLRHVQKLRGDRAFSGYYRWNYYGARSAKFPANFIHMLNAARWVPDGSGVLHPPGDVVFQDTGWEEDSSLAARIRFKPAPVSDALTMLAKVTGFEPAALERLKEKGITSESDINKLIELWGLLVASETATEDCTSASPSEDMDTPDIELEDTVGNDQKKASNRIGSESSSAAASPRKFVSYVAVNPGEVSEDHDGANHEQRINLEKQAIALILLKEPELERMPTNNPGFDLLESDAEGNPVRWIEVKAMKGTLNDRPVGLTSTQFELAQKKRHRYWLYIVENAGDLTRRRLLRIKNPAGKARTFTFDHGWASVAEKP